jgi:hypothetical protein
MKQSLIKSFVARSTELVVAVSLVLLFFLVLLSLFNLFFPMGTGLVASVGGGDREGGIFGNASRLFSMAKGKMDYNLAQPDSWAARLEKIERNVRSKRSDSIVWWKAKQGMDLFDRDAVQTMNNSSAIIRFDEDNYIKMADNSLVVIKKYEEDLLFREKRSFMVVVDGELEGTIDSSGEKSVRLEIATPAALTTIRSGQGEFETANFKISVEDDKSSVVTVYSGSAQVESQGEKVLVQENQAARIELNSAPSKPVELPSAPKLFFPENEGEYQYQSLPPKVHFNWKNEQKATGYHLVIARDPELADILIDEKNLVENHFVHGNLKKGDYYWRVSALASGGEGRFSEIRKLSLIQDRIAPHLEVEMPPDTISSGSFRMAGNVEPEATLLVNNNRVTTLPSGEFSYDLELENGMNMIVVEAMDPAGNVSFRSKFVNCKKQ